MKKLILLIFIGLILSLIVGCGTTSKDVDIKTTADSTEIEIEDKETNTKLEIDSKNTDDWCNAGSNWKMTSEEATSQLVIVGLVDSGKYKGFCHVRYDVDSAEGQADIDLYFDEEGNGYQVMVMDGKTFESEWIA